VPVPRIRLDHEERRPEGRLSRPFSITKRGGPKAAPLISGF